MEISESPELPDNLSGNISLDSLPPEILEMIFAYIPLPDLLKNIGLTCHRFKDIAFNPKFLPWKKTYYRIKKRMKWRHFTDGIVEHREIEDGIKIKKASEYLHLVCSDFINPDQCVHPSVESFESITVTSETAIPWLIGFVLDKFQKLKGLNAIEEHSKYGMACDWIKQSCSHIFEDVSKRHLTCIVIICCIAENIWEIRELIKLIVISNLCKTTNLTEMLYCIASAFCAFQDIQLGFPTRYEYLIVHSLYIFENDWKVAPMNEATNAPSKKKLKLSLLDHGFQRTVSGIKLTAEQLRIINHPIQKEESYWAKIVAYAGTGKTTTLMRLCQANPEINFLLVVYNKTAKVAAESIFPPNVKCMTAHGMAMKKCGFKFFKKLTSNVKARDIMNSKLMSDRHPFRVNVTANYMRRAAQIAKTIENYMNSADEEIEEDNVPVTWETSRTARELVPKEIQEWVLHDAKAIWASMSKPNDPRIRMPHDGYMKCFQLTKPNLQNVCPHDVLLIDEGQDMNPTMLEVFMLQQTPKIIVGDPNQQIYAFRGAVNALGSINPRYTFYLTQSFRFGPEIAFVANCCLETLKGPPHNERTLVGGKKEDFLITDTKSIVPGAGKYGQNIAVIGRTNQGLLKKVINLICKGNENVTGCFAGGIESYNLDDYIDLIHLQMGQNSKMKKWKMFKSFADFVGFATNTNDVELLGKVEVVKTYGRLLLSYIPKIKQACSPVKGREKCADYIFTTAHKAKGLEWNTVVLLPDFPLLSIDPFRCKDVPEEEKNIIYVAITRAKKYLSVSYSVYALLTASNFHFHTITKLMESTVNCCECRKNFTPMALSLKSANYPIGMICPECLTQMVREVSNPEFRNFLNVSNGDSHVLDGFRVSVRFLVGPKISEDLKIKHSRSFVLQRRDHLINILQLDDNVEMFNDEEDFLAMME